MSQRPWLRDRRVLAATVGLALAAAVAQWLLWLLGPAPTISDVEGPPRSGYTLHVAQVSTYDKSGQPSFRLQAPRLERREGDGSLYVDAPTFQLPAREPGIPDWQGQSAWGWVNKDATLLKLLGPVQMHRAAYDDAPQAEIQTENLSLWPHDKRLATAAPAQMTQGDTRISGVGMHAELNEKHLELLDDVHATFPPRQRPD
ncbi:MAG: LPS export ABC transporter periplasmic protein LptC [Rhodanobacter sp.]